MEQRRLGTSGPLVSLIGLGCNNFGRRIAFAEAERVIERALELGVTFFDTSDTYGYGASEEYLGRVLGPRRKQVVLATKFGMQMDDAGKLKGASRGYILYAVEQSLRRLNTDWIDLYQLHRPDPATPIEETLRALDDLVRQGKVRQIGCSTLGAAQLEEALGTSARLGLAAFSVCQDEYSLLERGIEAELMPVMKRRGLGLLPFLPLAGGLLTGKYRRNAPLPAGARLTANRRLASGFLTEANWRILEQLSQFCRQRGRGLLELALAWLASRPLVASIIAGATQPEQVAQNVAAGEWRLRPEELAEIDALTAARIRS